MASVTYVATMWSAAVYIGFLTVFGEEAFDIDFSSFNEGTGFFESLLGFAEGTADLFVGIINIVTLGGFDSPLGSGFQAILLTLTGLLWLIALVWASRGVSA